MNTRLTPLNILVSALLVAIGYLLVDKNTGGWKPLNFIELVVLVLVCFISDLLFRRFVIDLKRIWIIELAFIIFAAVVMLTVRRVVG